MSDIKQRVMENIRSEARKFLRHGTPMPERDQRWHDLQAKLLVEERELYEKEVEAQHMADYETMNARLKKAYESSCNDVPYDEWLAKAQKLYTISGSHVTSIAKGPHNEVTVDAGSPWLAKKRVLQLIAYKYRDHFQRGYDFMWDPNNHE